MSLLTYQSNFVESRINSYFEYTATWYHFYLKHIHGSLYPPIEINDNPLFYLFFILLKLSVLNCLWTVFAVALITFKRKELYTRGLKLIVYVLYMDSKKETLISYFGTRISSQNLNGQQIGQFVFEEWLK